MRSVSFLDEHYPVKAFLSDNEDLWYKEDWKTMEGRRKVLKEYLSLDFRELFCAVETHSGNICLFSEDNPEGKIVYEDETYTIKQKGGYDSLITNLKNVILCIWTADCVPVYIYDPVKEAIGMAHNGWRGACTNLTVNTIKMMTENFGTDPKDVLITFGACNCGNCYEISDDLKMIYQSRYSQDRLNELLKRKDTEKYLLDIKKGITFDLLDAGVLPEHIHDIGICTYENKKYASYRRDGKLPSATQTLSGIIMY